MSLQLRALAEREKRQRARNRENGSPVYSFKQTYRDDPGSFVRDCIRWTKEEEPVFYQLDALQSLAEHRRVSVRGPHGLGKTAMASWAILWFALTRDGEDWKIPTTASAWRQLTKFLWPEIRKWARRLDWQKINYREPFNERLELLSLSIKLQTGEAFALASDNAAMIEGAHAQNLLYIFDEAKVIPPDTWDAAEGAFSTGDAYWLAISTPGEPNGRFYDIQSRRPGYDDWLTRHVTLQEAIAAGRISKEWAEQRRQQWGEESAVYQNRVQGEFATSEEDGIISLSRIEKANERWLELQETDTWDPFTGQGVDVGRGGDKSVQALRHGWAIREIRRDNRRDVMPITGMTKSVLDAHPGSFAIIDVIGVGAGVVDRINEQGNYDVRPFNAGERTDFHDRSGELGFADKRSAAWWNMREILENEPAALPPDDRLTGDLTAPRWRMTSGGKIKVESKDDIKKRLGRSTDDGDAVVMAYWNEPQGVYFR